DASVAEATSGTRRGYDRDDRRPARARAPEDDMIRLRSNTRFAMRATERVLRQIPFATARALNRTALEFQAEQRAHQLRAFNVRRKQWVERNVKMRRSDFARQDTLVATVRIEAPGSDRSRDDIL